VILILNHF